MKKLLITILAIACLAAAGIAQADVLWDQSDYDNVGVWGLFDSVSGCLPFGLTYHAANDIHINDYVTITSISTWYSNFNFDTGSAVQAYLYIAPKTGSLPIDGVDDPQANGTLIDISVAMDGNGFWQVTAANLAVSLAPGDYWVSLTPLLAGGFFGPDTHIRSLTNWGDPSAQMEICGENAPTWFANGDGLDASLYIEGITDVVATEHTTWGDMKSLYR